jgi:tetratricopeptide (TPR) repeat protein
MAIWMLFFLMQVTVKTPLGKPMTPLPDKEGIVEKAKAALDAEPADAEKLLAYGNALDKVWRYNDAIEVYSRGVKQFPADYRFLRYRGHRFISTRQFAKAVEDLERARKMAPQSYDVTYHLALAYYLRGEYAKSASEYARCFEQTEGPALTGGGKRCSDLREDAESRISLTEWNWRALMRARKEADAEKLLASVPDELTLKESKNYYELLLFHKGQRTEKSLLDPVKDKPLDFVTLGYGVGLYYLMDGNARKACPLFRKIVDESAWNAFGYIAAETDIVRGACKDE